MKIGISVSLIQLFLEQIFPRVSCITLVTSLFDWSAKTSDVTIQVSRLEGGHRFIYLLFIILLAIASGKSSLG